MKPDLRPMLATLIDKPFDDPDWIFETKWDGFRLVAEVEKTQVRLYSRNLIDKSGKYPSICGALSALKRFAVIDGELVALDAKGRSRFQLLQNAEREKVRLQYCVFDLLYLDDEDLRHRPLIERKELLAEILPQESASALQRPCLGQGHRRLQTRVARGRGRRHGEALARATTTRASARAIGSRSRHRSARRW